MDINMLTTVAGTGFDLMGGEGGKEKL